MTDLVTRSESDAFSSTPLQRVAGRLQSALPPGWRVDVVDLPPRGQVAGQPVLRVQMPEN
ncbi:hypothetical protein [Nocardia asteroides]|uniref:Uncharacterized protein n=1 Tax=Nocardia asteroides NBRC 15531 TaxID=1110697 RepID=U5EGA5_NOCAS|nr:hypothetical protein [Nocardia asteroides]TLF69254.1 hypothetical protein FEK33_02795 [Nocardia asteroides NBRC 15531]UGT48743.1 hypothetical protein LT345_30630 [Nocardia asteroides]SFL69626.1 hypothetical protein SAMN05444423_101568 [Nocardia asteroides]VEG31575.1 Uncharacterised protein [Nocardia asteroides]GAD85431.1 hypothetical protein NCAST_31_01270 [Nocardia asteroides NBRC 15531]